MSGIIESIKTYPAKGDAGVELAQARLIEDQGLEGDFHARGGDRQISLLFAETGDEMTKLKERAFCLSRFKENISIRSLAHDASAPGMEAKAGPVTAPGVRLTVGEAILEITGETKHCHEECSLYKAGKRCPLAGLNLFARVLKGGIIRTGDKVEFAQ